MSLPDVVGAIKSVAEAPVPIRSTGWSWTAYGVWTLVAVMTPIAIAAFRMIPAMRKINVDADQSLRKDLMEEVQKLRKEQAEERADCDRKLGSMQRKMDAVTRQFVSFQLVVARYLPADYAPEAQNAANRLMAVIAQDVDEFIPGEEIHRPEPAKIIPEGETSG